MEIIDDCPNPKWHNIPCTCDHSSVLTEFPIKDCIHCKCEKQENSIPKNDFNVKGVDINNNSFEKTVTKITIVRGDKFEDCLGWYF